MGRRIGVGDNTNKPGKEGKHNTKQEIIKDEALYLYRLTSAGARPHLMHDFRAITIISFDAIEAYIHRYYI